MNLPEQLRKDNVKYEVQLLSGLYPEKQGERSGRICQSQRQSTWV